MSRLLISCLFSFFSVYVITPEVTGTGDQYILTFFGGRRVPHHRYGHYGQHWHQGHQHGPSPADPQTGADSPSDSTTTPPTTGAPVRGSTLRRAVLGRFSFSVMLRDGRRMDGVGGSQRIEPLGRLSEYVIRLSNISLDDVSGVIVTFETSNKKKQRPVKMTKIWISRVSPQFQRAQFNVPDNASTDMAAPGAEFLMYRACKMLNKDADKQLISVLSGTGYLCQDVDIENVIHEDEKQDWETLADGQQTDSHLEIREKSI